MRSKDAVTENFTNAAVRGTHGRAAEIFRAAAEVIMKKGFDATSMNDIAKAVDLTKAGLYHYISGKQDLLHAIMDFAMDTIESDVVEPSREVSDPEERLRALIWNHVHLLTSHGIHVAILTDEVTALTPAHRVHIIDRKRAYLDFVRETIQQLKDAGRTRELDVSIAALNILAVVVGMARWYKPDGSMPIDLVAEQTIQLLLGGILLEQ